MFRAAITALFLIAIPAKGESDYSKPKGDSALVDLYVGALVCAVVQHVNPSAVDYDKADYLGLAEKLKSYSYGKDPAKHAEGSADALFKTFTAERAIKHQGLRSDIKARQYYIKQLAKTDAKNCPDIPRAANEILKHYGLRIE